MTIGKSPMKRKKKGKIPSPALLQELTALESAAADRGIHVHYDRLEAAGLRLNSGLCTFNGEYHLFIEKRKTVTDKIAFLENQLERNPPNTGYRNAELTQRDKKTHGEPDTSPDTP